MSENQEEEKIEETTEVNEEIDNDQNWEVFNTKKVSRTNKKIETTELKKNTRFFENSNMNSNEKNKLYTSFTFWYFKKDRNDEKNYETSINKIGDFDTVKNNNKIRLKTFGIFIAIF
jgi:hypothetical protein